MKKEVKIKKIELIENNSLLYDIEVKDYNNFYANGILVHNCQSGTWSFKLVPRFDNIFGKYMVKLINKL